MSSRPRAPDKWIGNCSAEDWRADINKSPANKVSTEKRPKDKGRSGSAPDSSKKGNSVMSKLASWGVSSGPGTSSASAKRPEPEIKPSRNSKARSPRETRGRSGSVARGRSRGPSKETELLSKQVAWYLRHAPQAKRSPEGWIDVREVLDYSADACYESLKKLVERDSKGRYEMCSADGKHVLKSNALGMEDSTSASSKPGSNIRYKRIRAVQGHSTNDVSPDKAHTAVKSVADLKKLNGASTKPNVSIIDRQIEINALKTKLRRMQAVEHKGPGDVYQAAKLQAQIRKLEDEEIVVEGTGTKAKGAAASSSSPDANEELLKDVLEADKQAKEDAEKEKRKAVLKKLLAAKLRESKESNAAAVAVARQLEGEAAPGQSRKEPEADPSPTPPPRTRTLRSPRKFEVIEASESEELSESEYIERPVISTKSSGSGSNPFEADVAPPPKSRDTYKNPPRKFEVVDPDAGTVPERVPDSTKKVSGAPEPPAWTKKFLKSQPVRRGPSLMRVFEIEEEEKLRKFEIEDEERKEKEKAEQERQKQKEVEEEEKRKRKYELEEEELNKTFEKKYEVEETELNRESEKKYEIEENDKYELEESPQKYEVEESPEKYEVEEEEEAEGGEEEGEAGEEDADDPLGNLDSMSQRTLERVHELLEERFPDGDYSNEQLIDIVTEVQLAGDEEAESEEEEAEYYEEEEAGADEAEENQEEAEADENHPEENQESAGDNPFHGEAAEAEVQEADVEVDGEEEGEGEAEGEQAKENSPDEQRAEEAADENDKAEVVDVDVEVLDLGLDKQEPEESQSEIERPLKRKKIERFTSSKPNAAEKSNSKASESASSDNAVEVYHGTTWAKWRLINKDRGLHRMNRDQVHFAKTTGTKTNPTRASADVLIYLDLKKILAEGKLEVFESANGVVLLSGDEDGYVEKRYWKKVVDRKSGKALQRALWESVSGFRRSVNGERWENVEE